MFQAKPKIPVILQTLSSRLMDHMIMSTVDLFCRGAIPGHLTANRAVPFWTNREPIGTMLFGPIGNIYREHCGHLQISTPNQILKSTTFGTINYICNSNRNQLTVGCQKGAPKETYGSHDQSQKTVKLVPHSHLAQHRHTNTWPPYSQFVGHTHIYIYITPRLS